MLHGFFSLRDRVLIGPRLALVFALPMALSYAATRPSVLSDAALREQLIVLLALVVGFLMLAPRGDFTAQAVSAANEV